MAFSWKKLPYEVEIRINEYGVKDTFKFWLWEFVRDEVESTILLEANLVDIEVLFNPGSEELCSRCQR